MYLTIARASITAYVNFLFLFRFSVLIFFGECHFVALRRKKMLKIKKIMILHAVTQIVQSFLIYFRIFAHTKDHNTKHALLIASTQKCFQYIFGGPFIMYINSCTEIFYIYILYNIWPLIKFA